MAKPRIGSHYSRDVRGAKNPNHRHGSHGTPLYALWLRIKSRCFNAREPGWKNYGGRGIRLASEWTNDFVAFRDWILANLGPCPAASSLDRIDNDGNYEPGNLRWADHSTQMRNTRVTRLITHPVTGETKPIGEWADMTGLKTATIENRISRLGWSITEALATPARDWGRPSTRARRSSR